MRPRPSQCWPRLAPLVLWAWLTSHLFAAAIPGTADQARRAIAAGQRRGDASEVERCSREYTRLLGDQAGVPDSGTRFAAVPPDASLLPPGETRAAFTPVLERLEREAWWSKHPKPADMPQPLRMVASVVEGCLAAYRAGAEHPARLLEVARGGADFLVQAQKEGGHGCFPFPAMRGQPGRAGELAEQAIARAAAQGRLDEVLRNGWLISDDGNGDLQFDNGLAGLAVLRFHEATQEGKYLRSARAAADWAAAEPAVRNWNYNSFAVLFLADMFRVTGEPGYLEAAKAKARLGIYPGQLTDGPNRGRWNDPHNARLVYHYILLRGLAALVAVLPEGDEDLPRAREALSLGLRVRNTEILEHGIAHPETVLDTLSRIRLAPRLGDLPPQIGTTEAWEACMRFATAQFRRNPAAMPPGAWGLALEASVRRPD